MTGFATITDTLSVDQQQVLVTCTIKALNSRFLEINCKLPPPLQVFETEFIRLIKQELKRGNIVLTIHVGNAHLFKGTIEPSSAIVQDYVKAIKTIQQTYGITGSLDINQFIQLPHIFSTAEQGPDESIKSTFIELVKNAIALVQQARIQEGKVTHQDILTRAHQVQQEIELINKASISAIEQQKEKITKLLKELEATATELSKQLLEQQHNQLYDHLDKITIHEEIVRFTNHLRNLMMIIDQEQDELGKRIDFTVQEMAREINTIAAKSSDATISTHAINIKLELEKIKEQAQNIL